MPESIPETDLEVFEIPQVPGYRRMSRPIKSVAASLSTTLRRPYRSA